MFNIIPYENRRRSAVTYDPFRNFEDFGKTFFDSFLEAANFKMDIIDKGDAFQLEAELPGFTKEEIKVDINGDFLTISAEHSSETKDKKDKDRYIQCERSYSSYSRTLNISAVKSDEIAAEFTNGVLKLTLPKLEETVPATRRLEIK